MAKPTNQMIGRAGEHLVTGEILRRGGYATPFAGNMPDADVLAADKDQARTVWIQVKSKRGGKVWQTSTTRGRLREEEESPIRFWILVDLSGQDPEYYIVPEWWMQNNIHEAHHEYLAKHGGKRARTADSTHHAISIERVVQWRDRWDVLGIF